jgi:similar to stage IV sporulation protein
MKHIQGAYLKGYVTVLVKGNMPELFFQKCNGKGIAVWNVKKVAADACEGNIKLRDIKYMKALRRQTSYKLTFTHKKGSPFLLARLLGNKQLLIGLILSIMLIIFLSNIIWEVKITGVPKDIEEKISKQLNEYGIHSGSWVFSLDSPGEIQQKLVYDIPELLWVGVDQKGTTYYLEGVEKTIVKKGKIKGPQNLVATKKGVIKKMYVTKGLPMVEINDYVEPGDILVSGVIDESLKDDNKDTEKDDSHVDYVAAEGDITATTWYEVTVTVPMHTSKETLTGNREKKYDIRFGKVRLPIWGFGTPEYAAIHRESNEKPIRFVKWDLPVRIVSTTLSEKVYNKEVRTKRDAIAVGMKQAKQELQLELGPEAVILSEKILHETSGHGKVKLNLYLSVEEDIIEAQPIKKTLNK